MTDLVDTTEMYLRTIVDLEEEGIAPYRARIAERIGHSGPTVSQTVGRMERDGLVVVEADRRLALTPQGREKALSVARKHRLAERLLADVIGLDWALVHDEACRWEHVMSEDVERRLVTMLGQPTESPYGNPIPGLDKIGGKKAKDFLVGVIRVTDWVSDQPRQGLLRRLGEPAQFDTDLLREFKAAGLIPGARVTARELPSGDVELMSAADQQPVVLTPEVARHVYLAA